MKNLDHVKIEQEEKRAESDTKSPNLMNLEIDKRPHNRGWSAGEYICKCSRCLKEYLGAKRSFHCADCAHNDELFGKPSGTCTEMKWSDGDIVNVAHYESGFEIELFGGTSYTAINDEDLAVLVNARGFDLVKREGGD